ncbi:hypothetical protein VR43_06460 [Streptomyces sp. NRRL S-104]|nr:hypothetical protein VR43_06460 [Streptomyces sp. NRRL S-104]
MSTTVAGPPTTNAASDRSCRPADGPAGVGRARRSPRRSRTEETTTAIQIATARMFTPPSP